jgi:hypothetical protein
LTTRSTTFSDFTGQMITDFNRAVRITVLRHPELEPGRMVELDALLTEVEGVENRTIEIAEVTFQLADGTSETFILPRAVFDTLAKADPMPSVLERGAQAIVKQPKARPTGERIDYTLLENAGTPHRGRVTEAEAAVVRGNLTEINERLAREGHRLIDPSDPQHAERYGF